MLFIFTHPDCARHNPVPGHPESPVRLRAVLEGLDGVKGVQFVRAEAVEPECLARVHGAEYLDHLERLGHTTKTVALDADTHLGPGSLRAAKLAAGAACQAVDKVMAGEGPAFCVVRPPGHHAEGTRAMGFCIYNSIAVAAAHALALPGIERVAVCDFDVHHGNGTEQIFCGMHRVCLTSSHQIPLYPGTGDPATTVAPNVHNHGLPPGSGSDEFRAAWQSHLLPAVERFRPDLILVAAGFDGHWRDPLAQLNLKDEDYYWIGSEILKLANRHAEGRIVATLEGGYDLAALRDASRAFAEGILGHG